MPVRRLIYALFDPNSYFIGDDILRKYKEIRYPIDRILPEDMRVSQYISFYFAYLGSDNAIKLFNYLVREDSIAPIQALEFAGSLDIYEGFSKKRMEVHLKAGIAKMHYFAELKETLLKEGKIYSSEQLPELFYNTRTKKTDG